MSRGEIDTLLRDYAVKLDVQSESERTVLAWLWCVRDRHQCQGQRRGVRCEASPRHPSRHPRILRASKCRPMASDAKKIWARMQTVEQDEAPERGAVHWRVRVGTRRAALACWSCRLWNRETTTVDWRNWPRALSPWPGHSLPERQTRQATRDGRNQPSARLTLPSPPTDYSTEPEISTGKEYTPFKHLAYIYTKNASCHTCMHWFHILCIALWTRAIQKAI